MRPLKFSQVIWISSIFGIFQGGMPVIGWMAGLSFRQYIESFDHWIAFGLLMILGIKMVYESTVIDDVEKKQQTLKGRVVFVMAFATSIDALAVGLGFSLLGSQILLPVLIIGFVTVVLSIAGLFLGSHFGYFFEGYIERIGGIILMGIGIKILLEHTLPVTSGMNHLFA